ncbi:MAG TPA: sulfatase-like hydrolase/transferase [Vicinamibacterales bacterium]|nr:sulfatase-like hydrolase/transferase [Vicinamibacterales bacterium]
MKKSLLLLVVAGPVVVLAIGVALMRGRPQSPPQPIAAGALRGANVLLVTIDTLRADHVGVYGSEGVLTPTIDQFAKEGLRFERTYAHVPLTLPSHASLLTASYPTRNGVHDNGTFRLGDAPPTLAAALKQSGYRTAAFVGSFVLDARFGLGRGFDVYDDRMNGSSADLEVVQRTAEEVLKPAYQWITGQGSGIGAQGSGKSNGQNPAAAGAPASSTAPPSTAAPSTLAPSTSAPSTAAPSTLAPSTSAPSPPWFAWVHLYDPHEPYAPPEPYRSQYASEPYDGEIAYTDASLGAFFAQLRRVAALDNTLVVIASDHGEALGEHGERTHGLFAYDATLRVPLVMWAPPRLRPGVFGETMRLVDVAPTVLDLIGAAPMAGIDGRSIRPFVSGEQPFDHPASYFEALDANLTRGWAPLTGVVRDRLKLIDLPIPELYDLAADPGERHNLYAPQRERARDLESRLDQIAKGAAPAAPAPIDPDAEARLRALGYVVSSPVKRAERYGTADDPKQLVHLDAALDNAAAQWSRGDSAAAIETLRGVIRERPGLTMAYDRLAFILRATGRVGEGIALLDGAARAGHADRSLLRSLGSMLRDTGDLDRSAAVLGDLVRGDATDLQSADALGQTYTRMGRGQLAEAMFRRVLTASPNAAATWNNLGALYLAEHRTVDAIDALTHAIAVNPDLATAHNGLGVAYATQGDTVRAAAEWQKALALRPGYRDAQFNLDRLRK